MRTQATLDRPTHNSKHVPPQWWDSVEGKQTVKEVTEHFLTSLKDDNRKDRFRALEQGIAPSPLWEYKTHDLDVANLPAALEEHRREEVRSLTQDPNYDPGEFARLKECYAVIHELILQNVPPFVDRPPSHISIPSGWSKDARGELALYAFAEALEEIVVRDR